MASYVVAEGGGGGGAVAAAARWRVADEQAVLEARAAFRSAGAFGRGAPRYPFVLAAGRLNRHVCRIAALTFIAALVTSPAFAQGRVDQQGGGGTPPPIADRTNGDDDERERDGQLDALALEARTIVADASAMRERS